MLSLSAFFFFLFYSLCVFVSVHMCVCTSVQPSREGKKQWEQKMMMGFVLRASILLCVFLCLFLFLFFFLSAYLFLWPCAGTGGPVRSIPALVRLTPPVSQGWWLMALKSTHPGKRVFNCSYTHPYTLTPLFISVYVMLHTNTFSCINTVLDPNTCTHTNYVLNAHTHTHTLVSYPLQQLAMTGQLTGLFMSRGCLLVVL